MATNSIFTGSHADIPRQVRSACQEAEAVVARLHALEEDLEIDRTSPQPSADIDHDGRRKAARLRIKDPVELLYVGLMLRWERTAPLDGHQGLLDGEPERNTQISRMAYVLRKIASGTEEYAFGALARYTRRRDGKSYISKDRLWMKDPYPLLEGWYFEGCTSLRQKQSFLQCLTRLGLSPAFVACADDFVAGKSIEKHVPTDEEQDEIVRRAQEEEQCDAA